MGYGKPVVQKKRNQNAAVPSKGVSAQVRAMGGRAWGASKKAANAPVKGVAPSLPSSAAAKAVSAVAKRGKKV